MDERLDSSPLKSESIITVLLNTRGSRFADARFDVYPPRVLGVKCQGTVLSNTVNW